MKRFAGWGVTIVVLCWAAWFFFWPRTWPIVNLPPKSRTIVLFGDSLAYGTGSEPGNDLASLIGSRFGLRLLNLGTPGDTTEDGLGRVDQAVAHHPGLAIVCFGGNDAMQAVPSAKIESNLRAIVERLQQGGAVVCLLGIDPPNRIGYSYSAIYERVARESGSLLVRDVLAGVLDNPAMKADTVHPNNEGYRIIAAKIAEVLEPAILQMPVAKEQ